MFLYMNTPGLTGNSNWLPGLEITADSFLERLVILSIDSCILQLKKDEIINTRTD